MFREIISTKLFDDPKFPLAVMRNKGFQGAIRPPHCHDFYELVVVFNGHGRHITEEEDYPISSGDVFLIVPEQAHTYAEAEKMDYVNILFDFKRLKIPVADLYNLYGYNALFTENPRQRKLQQFESHLTLDAKDLLTLSVLISQLEDELAAKRPGYRFMACARLMTAIGHISRCHSHASSSPALPVKQVSDVLSFIENHYTESITLSQLAGIGHMSVTTLVQLFRKATGFSPIDYLIHVRIAKASELLQKGNVRVIEAALKCGFLDSNYFSRQFRKIVGISPRQFRASPMALSLPNNKNLRFT